VGNSVDTTSKGLVQAGGLAGGMRAVADGPGLSMLSFNLSYQL
jgi:hypothetical protein